MKAFRFNYPSKLTFLKIYGDFKFDEFTKESICKMTTLFIKLGITELIIKSKYVKPEILTVNSGHQPIDLEEDNLS